MPAFLCVIWLHYSQQHCNTYLHMLLSFSGRQAFFGSPGMRVLAAWQGHPSLQRPGIVYE